MSVSREAMSVPQYNDLMTVECVVDDFLACKVPLPSTKYCGCSNSKLFPSFPSQQSSLPTDKLQAYTKV